MKIAFQMEKMSQTVNGETHGLLLMEEACRRGHEVFHYCPEDISLDLERMSAPVATVHVDLSRDEYFTLGEYRPMDLSTLDIIMFRQDPPFDMGYFTNTVVLDMLKSAGVMCINDPFWIRNMPDKFSIFDFKEYMPPTLVSRDIAQIKAFFETHGDVVIKPLYSFHGHGIKRASSAADVPEMLEGHNEPLMFQPFLPEVFEGNKRIVFYDGEVVGALKSVPPQGGGEFRIFRESNDIAYEPTEEELEMCARMGPMFKERGLIFVGIDLIGRYLTEINVGSVGSLLRLNEVYGGRWEAKLWDVIERKFSAKNP